MGSATSKGYSSGISETCVGASDDGDLSCLVWDLIIREAAAFDVSLPILKVLYELETWLVNLLDLMIVGAERRRCTNLFDVLHVLLRHPNHVVKQTRFHFL